MSRVRRYGVPDGRAAGGRADAVERLLGELPNGGSIPRKEGELAFEAPWEVRALGMAVGLYEQKRFSWSVFQNALIEAVREWEEAPVEERGDWSYYRCWTTALVRVASDRGLIDPAELEARTTEFAAAARDPKHH